MSIVVGMAAAQFFKRNYLILLALMGFLSLSLSCVAQDHTHDHGPVDPDLEALRAGRAQRAVSVGIFTGLGKDICRELELDGRALEFGTLIESFSDKDKACPACRPLMRTLSVPCIPVSKPQPKRRGSTTDAEDTDEAKVVPTPSPTARIQQLVPSAPAIRAVVDYSLAAADHEQAQELKKAFNKIEIALRSGKVSSARAREYFDILLEYMLDPMKEVELNQEVEGASENSEVDGKANRESVDTLFE